MSIYKTAIEHPVTTTLVFVAVIVIGLFCLSKLPIDNLPEMDPPYVSIMTSYAGANASEIETNVTKLLEDGLNSVDGLKEITSSSKDYMSLITMEFEWGSDIDEAVNNIRSAIDMVYDNLPDDVNRPLIFKFNTSSMPVIQYAVTASESYSGLDKIIEDQITNVLNRVNGIGNIAVSGVPDRYVYIDLDPQKLEAYNLSVEAVGQAVSSNNLNLASGSVKMGREQYQMRVQSEYIESSEMEDIVIATTPQGKQIHIGDIAEVRDTIKDLALDERINGEEGARIIIMKQSGANTVQVCEDVEKEMARIQKTLPPDIKIQQIYSSAESIQNAVSGLSESVMYALLFVVLVVLFFLGRWRATLIISITIPISLIVAFIYLKMVDSSLNIISLCSLSIAIGMVVDDAIVVLENITKHIDRGENPHEAAIYATNEVWVSVIATTLVIVAVFVPLTMLNGQAGIMFKELGWIVTIVCCTSTAAAITLIPMLCSRLLKAKPVSVDANGKLIKESGKAGWYERTVVRALDKLDVQYARLLKWCVGHKAATLGFFTLLLIVSFIPVMLGAVGTDFMAQQDNGRMSVTIELQRGSRVEETMAVTREIEKQFMTVAPEIQLISSSCGSDDDGGLAAMFTQSDNNKIAMTVRCPKKYERERTIWEIAESLRGVLNERPDVVTYTVSTAQGGSSNTVDFEIYGYDFDETNILAAELKRKFQDIPGARDVDIDREDDRSEIQLVFDKEKLARHGLSSSVAAMYIRNRITGFTAGYLKEDGKEYDIRVRLQEKYRDSMEDIRELSLLDAYGKTVKVKELADVQEYWAPPEIKRKSRQRYVTIKVTPEGTSMGELAAAMQAKADEVEMPAGITTAFGGSYQDQQETFGDMSVLLLMIIMLVYIVMASQFEDLKNPFIIMSAAVFALPGVIFALTITGTSLDMIGALGVILLVGICVKNGIVLVDYTNLMRERGHNLTEAITMAGASRLRPVLMTALTTILGMVPMALATSEGSEMWRPMGIVIIGGLTVSTFVTLIVVPVLYGIFNRKSDANKLEKRRKQFIFLQLKDNEQKPETEAGKE